MGGKNSFPGFHAYRHTTPCLVNIGNVKHFENRNAAFKVSSVCWRRDGVSTAFAGYPARTDTRCGNTEAHHRWTCLGTFIF